MKKKLFLFALLFAISSCAVFAQNKKVAIVTFYGDKYIKFSELSGNAMLVTSIASLANDTNFNIKSIVNDFHDAVFNDFSKDLPFDLYPEEKVITNPAYMAYESKFGETDDDKKNPMFQHYITANGYKPLREFLNKKYRNELKMLEIFGNDVDGVMFVYIDFEFAPKFAIGGMGSAGVKAFVRMKCWNKKGEKVFAINEYATSDKSVPLVAGIPAMNPEKLLPMCKDATAKLLKDLKKRIPKITAKVEKKL
jgi:hypothetical protein